MSHFLLLYNNYQCTLLINGYQRFHTISYNDINDDVCSVIIEYIVMPIPLNPLNKILIDQLALDQLDCILLYETMDPQRLPQNFVQRWKNHKIRITLINESKPLYIESWFQTVEDEKLFKSISMFIEFSRNNWVIHDQYDEEHNLYYDKYWDIIIKYGKKWMNAKYDINGNNEILELIELYESYYCNMHKKNLLLLEKSRKWKFPEIAQWKGNEDQIRMSQILQAITVVYQGNVLNDLMKELNEIVEFIKVKYEMLSDVFNPFGVFAREKDPSINARFDIWDRYNEYTDSENQELENDPFQNDEDWIHFQ